MVKKQKKQEALSVSRLINEVLVAQLSIPFRQIVNDTTFSKYINGFCGPATDVIHPGNPQHLIFPSIIKELALLSPNKNRASRLTSFKEV